MNTLAIATRGFQTRPLDPLAIATRGYITSSIPEVSTPTFETQSLSISFSLLDNELNLNNDNLQDVLGVITNFYEVISNSSFNTVTASDTDYIIPITEMPSKAVEVDLGIPELVYQTSTNLEPVHKIQNVYVELSSSEVVTNINFDSSITMTSSDTETITVNTEDQSFSITYTSEVNLEIAETKETIELNE